MDSIASIGPSLYSTALSASSSAGASAGAASSNDSIGPAASLELSTLQLQGQMISTLLGGMPAPADASGSLFAGGSMLSLLNAQGSAAMAYLTPQAAAAGQTLNALA